MAKIELKDDWESVALRHVASRFDSLTAPAQPGPGEPEAADDGFGWEESVLQRLRKRLFSDDLAD